MEKSTALTHEKEEALWMRRAKKWILWGIPLLFAVGSLFHFIYEFTGNLFAVGLFAPVNESVFEHTKLVVLPLFLWWLAFLIPKQNRLNLDKWLTAALVSIIVSAVTIPMLFYFYTGAFGVELLWVDIIILLLALAAGQLLGLHYLRYGRGIPWQAAFVLLVLVLALFVLGTLSPPKLPIFRDGLTGLYGIFKTQ